MNEFSPADPPLARAEGEGRVDPNDPPTDLSSFESVNLWVDGVDVDELIELKENAGSVAEYEGAEGVSNADLLALDLDVLFPVALGGVVTASYFEWVRTVQNMKWEEEKVSTELEGRMTKAYDRVSDLAREAGVTLPEAAFIVSAREVVRATELRAL